MADQTLDQLPEELVADDADLLYAVRDGTDIKVKRGVLINGLAPSSRAIATVGGVKGGGTLENDLSLSLDVIGLPEDLNPNATADYVLTHDASDNAPKRVRLDRLPGGGGTTATNAFANIAVAGQSTVSADSASDELTLVAGSNIAITTNATTDTVTIAATNVVPATRNVSAGAGLSGGGALTADRNLAVSIVTLAEDLAPEYSSDYVMTHDSSTATLKKVRLSLLNGTAYTLPVATASTLGGIKIGSGLTIDAGGVVSATSSYTLPAATAGTLGGVRVGTGLSIDGSGILTNSNPTPYTLPIATVGTLGGVRAGSGVSIAPDGTLSVEGGGGTGVSDGAYRPESYGAIRGTGLTLAQRQANTTAINACWSAAGSAKARVDMGGGTFEVSGVLVIAQSGFVISGDYCTIRQYQSGVSVVAASSVDHIKFSGFNLTYGTNQTTGDNPTTVETYAAALRLSAVRDCVFSEIDTSNAWVGVGVSASTGSFNNTFVNIKCNVVTGNGYGFVHKSGTGTSFIGCRVTGNGTTAVITAAVHFANMAQSHFTQMAVEYVQCFRPMWLVACQTITFSGTVLDNVTPTATAGYGGLIHGSNSSGVQMAGLVVSNTRLNNTLTGIANASVFVGELGANFLATNAWITNTVKTGTVRFALLGHISSAPARNVTGTFQQIRLDTRSDNPHRLDDLCYATVDPASDILDGPLLSYNSSFGGATGGYTAIGDEAVTAYSAVHGRHLRYEAPLTASRTVTLSQYIDKPYANSTINAPRTYRGAMMRVERAASATGNFDLTVANHNGGGLLTLAPGARADFMFNGTDWVVLVSQSGGSGGGGGTFATQAEAEAGASNTTYMSPLRTKNAIDAYATQNEIAGTEGQVVGFNTAGDAVVVKNTRAIVVPIIADANTVTTGTSLRNMRLPIGIKLTAIEGYTPSIGSGNTTFDINLNGSSIFTTPPTIPANTATVSHTVFATGTLPKGGILTFDVDLAGSGARGLQVTLIGTEV